jgi:succinyl-diaminopimelate desuccinylase
MMDKAQFLDQITADAESHIELLRHFIQAPSPNPPGTTAAAAQVLLDYLNARGVETEIIAPDGPEKPNFVAEFVSGAGAGQEEDDSTGPGQRVILNGHLDVFPVDPSQDSQWTHGGPWSGHYDGTYIFGRGGVDMKAGTAASVIAFAYLHRYRQYLRRKHSSVALTVVSDEETGGKFGSRYLLEQDQDKDRWKGTVMINAEPGGLQSIRFGEKGTLRMTFTITTLGVHGAYTHLSEGANRIAARLIGRLVAVVEQIEPTWDDEVRKQLEREEVRKVIDEIMGQGAHRSVLRPTVNIGTIHGGIKVNMIPDRCVLEADIRLPIGLRKEVVLEKIDKLLRDEFPSTASYEVQEAASNPASHCSPSHEMVTALADAAEKVTGRRPLAIPSLGATDAKFWRYHHVPAYVHGVSPETMAAAVDERVRVDEFLSVVRTHALAVWSFLGGE